MKIVFVIFKWTGLWLFSLLMIAIAGCGIVPASGVSTLSPTAYYTAVAQTPLRECPERSCTVISVVSSEIVLPIVAHHDKGSDYWLEVAYNRQSRFVGPFIMVDITYSYPRGAARSCPNRDCPVRFILPGTDYILSLDVVVTNLVEYWTHTVYQGEEVYFGPWMPPPSNSVWTTTVIPASETARANETFFLSPTPPPTTAHSSTATLVSDDTQ